LATLLTDTPDSIARAEDAMTNAFTVGQTFQPQDIVIDTVVARS
jgi:thymidine phosphorylase